MDEAMTQEKNEPTFLNGISSADESILDTQNEEKNSVVVKLADEDNVFRVRKEEDFAITPKQLKRLSNALASGHLNFIIGSGFSFGLIPTLLGRESWFTAVEHGKGQSSTEEKLLQAEYCSKVILPAASAEPAEGQVAFLQAVKDILKNRGNTSIPRRANIFTTNYDLIIEKACEEIDIPYNDGFSGRLSPVFSTEAFSRVLCEQSFAHEYLTQVPTLSVMKMHGSLSWQRDGEHVTFVEPGELLGKLQNMLADKDIVTAVESVSGLIKREWDDKGMRELEGLARGLPQPVLHMLDSFAEEYAKLCIVNPTKRKFEETILDLGYYELMRLYSNELDRSNTLLISEGFSFRDEHILEITKRALNNPMLLLIVFCHSQYDLGEAKKRFCGFDNVWFIAGETEEIKIDAAVAAKCLNGVIRNG